MTAEEYIKNYDTKYCHVRDRFLANINIICFACHAAYLARKEEREKALLAFSEVSKYCEKCNKKCSSDCSISCLEDKFKELINK